METVWPPPEENDETFARFVHAQLLHRFNLTAQQLPLLELNISDRAAPFRLAPRLTGAQDSQVREGRGQQRSAG